MSLMKTIMRYDFEQEERIRFLEEELAAEKKINAELTTMLASEISSSERKTLQLIMAGGYDKITDKSKETHADQVED